MRSKVVYATSQNERAVTLQITRMGEPAESQIVAFAGRGAPATAWALKSYEHLGVMRKITTSTSRPQLSSVANGTSTSLPGRHLPQYPDLIVAKGTGNLKTKGNSSNLNLFVYDQCSSQN